MDRSRTGGSFRTLPEVMMGKPVAGVTRITVELILERLAAGETIEQILDVPPRLSLTPLPLARSARPC